MNKEINKLSKTNWPDMYEAMEKCTVAKTDAHKLLFLRCEQFNADVSLVYILFTSMRLLFEDLLRDFFLYLRVDGCSPLSELLETEGGIIRKHSF